MNNLEYRKFNLLKDLKQNFGASGTKVSFEDECADFEDMLRLKNLSVKTGLDLTVKIGGCFALNDMYYAKSAGADSAAAPMIESPYAASKFLSAAKKILPAKTKLYINIETKQALECLTELLKLNYSGVIFGRSDFARSIGLEKTDINNDFIFNTACIISKETKKYNKEFIIGGGIDRKSIDFLSKIPNLSKFETRKIIFDAKQALNKDTEKGLLKAAEFEIINIQDNINRRSETRQEYTERIKELERRFNIENAQVFD